MSAALRDTKNNPEPYMHPKSQPLRGNQLAQALSKAPLPQQLKANLFKPVEIDEAAVLRDVRAFLAKIVAGERVPTMKITTHAPGNHRAAMVKRLKERGLIRIQYGHYGGVLAMPKLIELARVDVSDDSLRALALTDLSDEERVAYRGTTGESSPPEAPTPTRDRQRTVTATMKPLPPSGIARDKELLVRVRGWLRHGATGAKLQISSIAGASSGYIYGLVYRIRDAGYIQRVGGNTSNVWYVVPENLRDHVRSMTDEQIVSLIWPSRVARSLPPSVPPPPPSETDLVQDAETVRNDAGAEETTEEAQIATQEASPMGGSDLEALLSRFLEVLLRMDARFARLERELGLKPIEQEAAK